MSFYPDPNKQAQEVIFSHKSKRSSQPPLIFNNDSVSQTVFSKLLKPFSQLGVILDFKLTFEEQFSNVLAKVTNAVGLLLKLITKGILITIYKAFIRSHLEYGDII